MALKLAGEKEPCHAFFLDMTWQLCIAGPQEGLKIRGGGHNLSPLVEIGLSDPSKSGWAWSARPTGPTDPTGSDSPV